MNQRQNAISLARVLASSLVGESQVWNLVKHRPGWKFDHRALNKRLCLTNGLDVDRACCDADVRDNINTTVRETLLVDNIVATNIEPKR